jgi:predicted AlkP superfamily phosphohydrolase/phosphomutase
MKKTLLIGFDAACWEYLNPLLASGRLPTLKKLMDTGIRGTLQSTLPALTPTAWGSIVTGKNPGKHGVYSHLLRIPGTYDFVPTNARFRLGTPFWNRLNQHGVKVGLVNIPYTYPPEPIDGFLVVGFGTPNSVSDKTYPASLLQSIESKYGEYEPTVNLNASNKESQDEIYSIARDHQGRLIQIAVDLADQNQVDVLVINLMLLDQANHKMKDMDQIDQSMIETDADIESLIRSFNPDNTMVISDHGSRRIEGEFLLFKWLQNHGYYYQEERSLKESQDALNWLVRSWLTENIGITGIAEKALRRVVREFIPRLSDRYTKKFWSLIESSIPNSRDFVKLSDQTDFSKSLMFSASVYANSFYFNVIGREPNGNIPFENYRNLAEEISEKLKRIGDPSTGDPLFKDIYLKEDIYSGPNVDFAPDIILDNYHSSWGTRGTPSGFELTNTTDRYYIDVLGDIGFHSRDGIFVFAGDDFGNGFVNEKHHVMDVPATLLYLYGVPIPDDYDGRVRDRLINPEFKTRHPIKFQPGDPEESIPFEKLYSQDETDELYERLRALGYVD